MEEYYNQIANRYMNLSEEEKESIRELKTTSYFNPLLKVLGPGMKTMVTQLAAPKSQQQDLEKTSEQAAQTTQSLMRPSKKRKPNQRKKPIKNRKGLASK